MRVEADDSVVVVCSEEMDESLVAAPDCSVAACAPTLVGVSSLGDRFKLVIMGFGVGVGGAWRR